MATWSSAHAHVIVRCAYLDGFAATPPAPTARRWFRVSRNEPELIERADGDKLELTADDLDCEMRVSGQPHATRGSLCAHASCCARPPPLKRRV